MVSDESCHSSVIKPKSLFSPDFNRMEQMRDIKCPVRNVAYENGSNRYWYISDENPLFHNFMEKSIESFKLFIECD